MKKMSQPITRRQFCGGTLGCVAGSALVSQRVYAADASPDAVRRLNIACIGMGGQMLGSDLKSAVELKQKIVAICDVDDNRIREAKKEIGQPIAGAKVYKDYRKLLEAEKSVDAVIIATPDHWHAPICKAAMLAGKHVYCEKPLTHAVAEAKATNTTMAKLGVSSQEIGSVLKVIS